MVLMSLREECAYLLFNVFFIYESKRNVWRFLHMRSERGTLDTLKVTLEKAREYIWGAGTTVGLNDTLEYMVSLDAAELRIPRLRKLDSSNHRNPRVCMLGR